MGRGHGKLLLFGEHAAVYGYPACGITLPLFAAVEIWGGGTGRWELPVMEPGRRETLERFLDYARGWLPAGAPWGGRLAIESNLPEGIGFGSSAAWCVAFASAVTGEMPPSRTLWEAAHRAECFFHGTPSGIDTGLALLDGLYAFRPKPPELPAFERLRGGPLHLIAGAVPREGSTRRLVGALRARLEAGEAGTQKAVERLGEVSARAIDLLRAPHVDPRSLALLANEAQELLAGLGLSSRLLDEMVHAGVAEGALGGKLSGAGGGGAFYLLFADAETAAGALAPLKRRAGELAPGHEPPLFTVSRAPLG
jgi:mevalonate kinase